MKKLPKINTAKLLKAALPYIFIGLMATKLGQAYRMVPEGDVLDKALGALLNIGTAFQNPLPSFHPFDLMVGAACGVLIWFIVYQKAKNARKYRRGAKYGTARWRTAPFVRDFSLCTPARSMTGCTKLPFAGQKPTGWWALPEPACSPPFTARP